MGIRVALHHKTVYQYDRLVTLSPQVVRLRPAPHSRTPVTATRCASSRRSTSSTGSRTRRATSWRGSSFPGPTTVFSLEVDLVAEMTVINPFDFFLEPTPSSFPFAYDELQRASWRRFCDVGAAGTACCRRCSPRFRATHSHTVDFLVDLNRRLQHDVRYLIRMEPGVQASEETLASASGSCRDSAWLLVEMLRHLGLAARFVSGYLIQLTPDEKPLDGPAGPAAGLHRSPRLGRGVPAGRRLGGPGSHLGPASPARGTFRWRRRRTRSRRRRSRASSARARSSSITRCR